MKLFVSIFLTFIACAASINVQTVDKIVLFDEIDLSNVKGVTPISGYLGNSAYRFADNSLDLIVNDSTSKLFGEKARSVNVFTVETYLRTNSTTFKPIMSLSLGPVKPNDTIISFDVKFRWLFGKNAVEGQVSFLDDSSDTRKFTAEIDVDKYTTPDKWLHFAAIVHKDENLVRFRVNNKFFAHKPTTAMHVFPTTGVMRVAQELVKGDESVNKVNRYEGELQNLTIIFDDCIPAPRPVPTMPPTAQPPITATTCPQPTTCLDRKTKKQHDDGEEWKETPCSSCICESGTIHCVQFCKLCNHEGKFHIDGTSWDDSSCRDCKCKDGQVSCVNTVKEKKSNGCERKCSDPASGPCPHTPRSGCFCPGNQVFKDGACQDRLSCPCTVKGNIIKSGELKLNSTHLCVCSEGIYSCTKF